ncbi:MAG: hypothetical protein U9O41_03660 [Candidatus Aerophobetes bacterium]|nr:hypothetical protein [Candidatus Aerophobetes bacterium]
MGRVRKNIIIDGHPCWTLFDTGARNTYIIADIANSLPKKKLTQPERVGIGGRVHHYDQICIMTALVEGKPVWTDACLLDEIGNDREGKRIEVLFGALAMQRWGIRPLPDEEKIDMSRYPKEFVEYL